MTDTLTSITMTWDVTAMDCYPQADGETDREKPAESQDRRGDQFGARQADQVERPRAFTVIVRHVAVRQVHGRQADRHVDEENIATRRRGGANIGRGEEPAVLADVHTPVFRADDAHDVMLRQRVMEKGKQQQRHKGRKAPLHIAHRVTPRS